MKKTAKNDHKIRPTVKTVLAELPSRNGKLCKIGKSVQIDSPRDEGIEGPQVRRPEDL
jgi:hypothetical protein